MNSKKFTVIAFLVMIIVPAVCFLLPFDIGTSSSSGVVWPKLSVKAIADKSFSKDIEGYLTQHFIERDQLVRMKTDLDIASGKKETNDVYVSNAMLLEKVTLPTDEQVDKSVVAINRFAQSSQKQVYFMMIPTSTEIYKEKLPAYSRKEDELGFINQVYAKVSSQITTLDAATPLASVKTEPIYYRTDRRLTSFGAYSVYNYNMKSMGAVPAKMDDFSIEHVKQNFNGSLYKKTQYSGVKPDVIDLYHYVSKPFSTYLTILNGTETTFNEGLYFRNKLESSDPQSVFLSGTRPYINIKSDNGAKKNLLVFADSNIGSMMQFLSIHYDNITIVDLNYMTEYYRDLIQSETFDNVLFLYSTTSFADSEKFTKLKQLSK